MSIEVKIAKIADISLDLAMLLIVQDRSFMHFGVDKGTPPNQESRATLACLCRASGQFFMLQLIIVNSRHFT